MINSPAGLVAAILTVVALLALAGYQVTTESAGTRLLGRVGSALIEVDRWLPAHREDIELLSRDRPNAPLVLSELPIEVSIPSSAAIDTTNATMRAAISDAMGQRLYHEGPGAVQDETGESHLSFTEPVRWAIELLGASAHTFWQTAVIVLGFALLAVCAGMVWMRQSPLLAMAVGGGVAAALSAAAWGGMILAGTAMDSALDREIALVLRDGAWIGLRNGLAACAIGLSAAYVVSSLVQHRREEEWPELYEPVELYEEQDRSRSAPPY